MKWKLELATVIFLTLAIFATGASAGAIATFFVSADVGGDESGSSWANASSDLAGILKNAVGATEIYVASGEYSPGALVTDSFILSKDVKLYDGFSGTGRGGDLAVSGDRNFATFRTILSGDTVAPYHVVLCSADSTLALDKRPTSLDTRLDGFIITGGKATAAIVPITTVAGCITPTPHP